MGALGFVASPPGLVCFLLLAVVAFVVLKRDNGDVQESPGPAMYDSAWTRLRRSLPHRRR